MKRRDALRCIAGGLSASLLAGEKSLFAQETPQTTRLGIVLYCFGIRQRALRAGGGQKRLSHPLTFLEHCHRFGAGGIQLPLGTAGEAVTGQLRQKAEDYGMFIEAIAGLPRGEADLERFEAELRTAKRAGAKSVRVVMMPGRRYERFKSAEEFREFARRGLKSLELAEPAAARARMRLALENHKDHRIEQRLAVLRHISSEYVGTCVDTGNSFALLEDPLEVVRAYAPWAFSVHLKDQAVREYEHGFLFADVPLGEGFLDLPKMVEILRKAKPRIDFSLEMIARDPLKVPCLTEKYWATFADVPGRELARTLRTVKAHACKQPLPQISGLPLEQQVEHEEDNIRRSLAYARERLGI